MSNDIQLSPESVIEEIRVVQSQIVGDLMQQIAVQRAINRQQEQTIILLRSRLEELTPKE